MSARQQHITNERMTTSTSQQNRKQRIAAYHAIPPSTGLDIALVGPADTCRLLASATLRVQFDRKIRVNRDAAAAAVEALVRTTPCCASTSLLRRHVYSVERLDDLPNHIRMDHIVVVVSPPDGHDTDGARQQLQETLLRLDATYVAMNRCSIVVMMESHHGSRDVETLLGRRRIKSVGGGMVPAFVCSRSNARSVARMILQRAKIGIRHGPKTLPQISPLIF